MKRNILLVLAALMVFTVGSFAGEITFAGTATGVFSNSGTNVYQGLTYTPGTFSGTTAGGFLGIGGLSGNFGTLSLSSVDATYSGDFTLTLTFALPAGSSGPGDLVATVTGAVSTSTTPAGGGAALISFTPASFTFSNPAQHGSFTVRANDVDVTPGESGQALNGSIIGTTVPEPASLALLGSGLLGVAGTIRRKLVR